MIEDIWYFTLLPLKAERIQHNDECLSSKILDLNEIYLSNTEQPFLQGTVFKKTLNSIWTSCKVGIT